MFWSVILYILGALLGLMLIMGIVAAVLKPHSVYCHQLEQKNPFEGIDVVFVEDDNDAESADGVRGHLDAVGESKKEKSLYKSVIKRILDIIISFIGLLLLSPVFLVLTLAIVIDDPGPVLFKQKRVGENKRYFALHKFRSMKMSTPHDIPTHMLTNPEQYITKVGRFIRAHSLDELPQIWDIFLGNMSIVGERRIIGTTAIKPYMVRLFEF